MSQFLDELARSLAQPMPRRRALRVIGVAIAGALLPASRAPGAVAGVRTTRRTTCNNHVCDKGQRLCECHLQHHSWGDTCNNLCCPQDYHCQCPPGASVCSPRCPPANECGTLASKLCCHDDEYCAGKRCCQKPGKACNGECCPPPKVCTTRAGSTKESCQCSEDTTPCGNDQCCDSKLETCMPDGTCCPSGGIATRTVIRKVHGRKTKVTLKFCCPKGTVATGDKCCKPGDPDCGCKPDEDCLPCLPRAGTWWVDGKCVNG